ncbi:gliding motility-associated C-terminal domain-containing protein [Flavobacterium pectinovorum]|uniref:Gliding motility-associated C-terminal domain-containing protein n=1 Tax=Flavobacterium pectinovorum TaxID=29533 RepID=A0A502EQ88_9FLAO|nr:gliding motility-associated C-terminal domain-containing protein [Flavobacterium pectinovorum]TPG39212.1 gliding motility-associated C-terminal domain-containing protein [Flavobacterium pectinovorum]
MKLNYSDRLRKGLNKTLLFFLFAFPVYTFSQNCTINANADNSICPGGDLGLPPDQFYLLGTSNTTPGSNFLQNPIWTQISGPAVQIVDPNLLQSLVKGVIPGNTYIFRLTAQCGDGATVSDDVKMTVLPITMAKAGPDKTYCQGSYALSGNAVGASETGTWTVIGNNNAGVNISSPVSPNSAITVSGTSSGSTTLRWTITNSVSNCTSSDEVVISSLGGKMPVTAGSDITLSNCYSATQGVKLNGSFGGNTPGQQQGTWTVVNGPNILTFVNVNDNNTNVSGLVQGTYTFKWTVAGTCANGMDEVTVIVPPPTADVTNVADGKVYFCDGRTSTVLKGTTPLYVNETVQWTQTGGPSAVIQNPTSPSTTISGMNTLGTYTFLYTLTNGTTNCVRTGTHTVTLEESMSISGGGNQQLGCGVVSATIPVTSGGNGQLKWQIIDGPVNPFYPSYPTSPVNFSGSSLTINNLIVSGGYFVRIIKAPTADSQCETVSDIILITISAQPVNSNAGTTQILPCNSTSATLAGNIPTRGKGKWSQVSGPSTVTFTDVNQATTGVSPLVNGRYKFRWTISGGAACNDTQGISDVVVSNVTPTISQAGNDQSVCFGTPVQLHGNMTINSETGTWTVSPNAGITFSNINDPNAEAFGLAQNTTYTFTWTVANGCGNSSDTVNVTTNNTQGATADAGTDQCLPTGTTSITLAADDPSPGNGLWVQTSGAIGIITNPAQFNTTVTGLSDGNFEFKWTVSNIGCTDAEDRVAITIAPTITIAQAGSDQSLCTNVAAVTGNTPAVGETGLWEFVSGGDGPIITNPTSPTTTITNLTPGNWVYKWTISRGICAASSDSVQLNIDGPPSAAIAGPDQVLCNQTSTTLAATTPAVGRGLWTLFTGPNSPVFSNPASATSTLSGLTTGVYTLEWATFNGVNCPDSSDQMTIKITEVAAAGSDFSTCLEGPLYLKGNDGSTGTWSYVSGGSGAPTITATGNNTASVTGLIPSVYVFRYTIAADGSCPLSSDDIQVTVNGQITTPPNAGPDQVFCNAGPVQIILAASPLNVGTTGKWTILAGPPGGSFANDTNPNTIFTNPAYGIYVFNWTVSAGSCSQSDQVRIENAQPPSPALAGGDKVICGSVTDLTAIPPLAGVGKWAQVSGPTVAVFSSQISPTTTVSNLTQTGGVYVFSWTVSNGTICTPTTDNVQITVTADLTVPKAGPDQTICQSGTATLAANAITAGTGKWTRVSGPAAGSFSNDTSPTSIFTPNGAGTYVLRWTAVNLSCTAFDDMTLVVDPLPSNSNAGTSITICEFQTLTLTANTPAVGTGLWTQVSGPSTVVFQTPTSPTTAVFGAQSGIYVFRWAISNGSCPSSSSNVTVTINALPPLADAGVDQTICNTTTTTLNGNNPSAGTGLWTFVSNVGSTALITNPNAFNTTVTNLSVGTTRLKWTITSGSCTPYSDEVNIERASDLTTSPLANNSIICQGGTLTLSTTPTGSVAPYTYQWQTSPNGVSGWTNVSGQTSASYTTSGSLTNGDYYYRVNVLSTCTQVTSNVARLTIIADPVITTQPTGNTICSGATHTMSVAATTTNSGAGIIIYQWQSSANGTSGWTNVLGGTGANTNTYTTAALNSSLYFRAQITQSGSGCETFSNTAPVNVTTITAQPTAPAAICIGGIVNISLSASLNGGTGTLSYQWQSNSGSGFVDETNPTATTANFTSDALNSTTQFRCLVTSSATNCTLTSNAVTATVVSDPAISAQPTGGIVCSGGALTLTVTATGGTPGLNYQWYSSSDNVSFALISGATSNTYNTPALTADTYYRVDVSATGNGCGLVASNSVLADVIPDPIVTQQPVGNTICTGGTHRMTVVASGNSTGGPLVYQWQRSTNGTTGWVNTTGGSGATTASYTTGALTSNFFYRVRIRQSANGCEVYSNAVSVYVVTITAQPVAPIPICEGGTINVSVTASLNGGAGTLSYQWQSNSGLGFVNESNASATTANFTSDAINTTTQFRCLVTSSTTNCVLTSNAITVNVVPDPTITVQPTGGVICSGGNDTLSVTATNGTPGLAYQWYSSLNNTTFTIIGGATSATYTTPALTQTTYYRVDISASGNGCTTITSNVAMITVFSAINIVTQPPLKSNICSGSNTTLNVVAAGGSGNYNYQWKSSTVLAGPYNNIAGATSASYTTPNLTETTYYQVVVSDPTQGCIPVTSSISTVIIPSIITQPATPPIVCIGGTVLLSALASANNGSASFDYQWQSSSDGTSGWVNVTGGTGATNPNYTSGPLLVTAYYRCVITSSNPTCTLITDGVKATVIPDPTITVQPVGGNICESGTFTMTSGAANGSGNFTYQWQKSLNGTTGWANVTDGFGANTTTYTTGTLTADIFFRLHVTDSGIGCGTIDSAPAKIDVFESPLISTEPADGEVCINQPHTFTIVASGNIPSSSLLYQWQTALVLAGPYSNVTNGSGGTTASYTTPVYAITGNRYFRVLISQSQSGCQSISNHVTLNVFDKPLVPIGQVTEQPSCDIATGTIAISTPDLGTGYEYSKDGSTFQASNIFSALPSGSVQIYVRRIGLNTCTSLPASFTIFNRICAVPETFTAISGGTGGNTGTHTILDSDLLNGIAVNPADVTLTINSISNFLTFDSTTNTISVAPGTPADNYTLTYTICENANPANCSTTTEVISVTTSGIDAVIDIVPMLLNGSNEHLAVINALTNDKLGTLPATISNVQISIVHPAVPIDPTILSVPVLNIATGDVDVPAGTVSGLYEIQYMICEIAIPSNCDVARIIVPVGSALIDADDDVAENINGYLGQMNVVNAFVNDSLNGAPITAANLDKITVTQNTAATPLYAGANVPVFSTATGNVSVPEGTPADTYYVTYTICEKLNPTNCADASIAIVVDPAPIFANDDVVDNVNGYDGAVEAINAFTNTAGADTFNGEIININLAGLLTASVKTPATPKIPGAPVPILLVSSGRLTVPPGTPAGQYQIEYEICENLNPGHCDDAIITINVIGPIIQANDDTVLNVNGYAGANNVINAYDNDLLNGGMLNLPTITTTITSFPSAINGGPIPTFDTATGFVSVPAGTPAGEYKFVYKICENLNPTNCNDAVITITVASAQIDALNDANFSPINGFIGDANALNALDNDTLNGSGVVLSEITISVVIPATPINGGSIPVLDPSTGIVSVPAGTSAGVYFIGYELNEKLNLSNNDFAVIIVEVSAPVIIANDDTVANINGYVTTINAIDVLLNDTLNGATTDISKVNITVENAATPINGGSIPVLEPLTGFVSVPAGTTAGDYEIRYQICEKLNPTNCNEATVFINVISAPIDAVDDIASNINGFAGAVNVVNAFTNDALNGVAVIPSQVTISNIVPAIPINGGAIPVLDPLTGNVNVPPGTSAGMYTIEYRLSENLNTTNFDTATITIDVVAPGIIANNDSTSTINGYIGAATVINAITNDRLNGADILLTAINITSLTTTNPVDYVSGNPVPILSIVTGNVDVPAGTSAGIYVIHYRICEKLNPLNCSEADITVNVSATNINADNDFANNIHGFVGANNVVNALTNDDLNGAAASILQVNIHYLGITVPVTSTNGIVPILNELTGNVDVPAKTSAGTYVIRYEICEKLNPANCSQADIILVVEKPTIVAEDDVISNINGYRGAPEVLNAFTDNDKYDGVLLADVSLVLQTILSPATPINGGLVPFLVPSTGLVTIPARTPAGIYQIRYLLCDKLNPTNCDDAVITIVVVAPPIIANDDEADNINGYAGANNVINAYDNDTIDGLPINVLDFTGELISPASSINGAPVPILNILTGNVDVPAGTHAGEYFIVYKICGKLNPTNCDEAVIRIRVIATPIDAVDDNSSGINGFIGTTNAINALDNDTLNGVAVIPSEVVITNVIPATAINSGLVPILDPATGIVSVPAGTPAGTYKITYTLREQTTLANNDVADITIVVDAPIIEANDDTLVNINGYVATNNAIDVLSNDTLNGTITSLNKVEITVDIPATPINGGPVPSLEPLTGMVSILAGTPAGTYEIKYHICEKLNPTNCNDATVFITIKGPSIDAVDDDLSSTPINGFIGTTNAVNVLDNDTLNGVAVIPSEVIITNVIPATPINSGLVPVLNASTGIVSVPVGTTAGNYEIKYAICEKLNLSNCNDATVFITVIGSPIDAVDDDLSSTPINGFIGTTNAVNVLDNDTLNGVAVIPSEVIITNVIPATPINSGLIPVLDAATGIVSVPAGTSAGTYTIIYTLREGSTLVNNDTAVITIVVQAPVIVANDDTLLNVNGYVATNNAIDVLSNDTLNGTITSLNKVEITVDIPATPINGGPVPSLEPLTGMVSILAGTPAGTYEIKYHICERINPTNCNDAIVFITVTGSSIDAVDDDLSSTPINGFIGTTNAVNVLDNDTLNGVAVIPSEVIITNVISATPINSGLVPVLDALTGIVSVPVGTTAGNYEIKYAICEKLNLSNCNDATVFITVIGSPIDAVDDNASGINGFIGTTNAVNVLDNDTLNGVAVIPSEVIITNVIPATAINSGLIPALDAATGIVSVPAGTSAGTYTIIYTLREGSTLVNNDTAVITIVVQAPVIVANDDTLLNVNGYVATNNAIDVLTNDTLNGAITNLSKVEITVDTPATPIKGGPVPSLEPLTGMVSILAGTPAGTYEIKYHICERLNPTNCNDATVFITITGPSILAVNDSVSNINGYVGATNVINAISNDLLNGVAAQISQINITSISITNPVDYVSGNPVPLLNTATGSVDVPPGTSAGTYTIHYGICEKLNATNCSEAAIVIEVNAATIIANDDVEVDINGYVGTPKALNIIDNDTFNDSSIVGKKVKVTAINISQITITVLSPASSISGNPNVPVLDPATGIVSVPAGTPAGLYKIRYRIAENLNTANFDEATVFITVTAATIQANTDSVLNINGFQGQANVVNAITNDNLNGVAAQLSQISIGIITPATSINGGSVPTLDILTGSVSVASGTPSGTYTIRYEICENLNPTNCSQADIIVTVISGPIIANDDTIGGINGLDGANNVINVLTNDLLDNAAPTLAQVKINVISPADVINSAAIPVLDINTGSVSIPAGTSSGIYTIVYQICENLNAVNCDQAVIKITVLQPSVTLVKQGVFSDTNGDGFAQPGELIRYSFSVTNTGTIDLNNVTITDPKATITGAPIATLAVGQVNVVSFTGTYVLTQADINLGYVKNQALVTAQPLGGTAIHDLSDSNDPTLTGPNDPTITPVDQFKQLTLIKGGQLTGTGGVGSIINYSFVVKNTGNVILNNIEIADPLLSNNAIAVTPNTLVPGETGTATASYTVTILDALTGAVVNTAVVVGDTPAGKQVTAVSDSDDPTLLNDDDPTVVDLGVVPSIAIIKTATFNDENKNGYAEIGETITYHFAITNTGNIPLVNIIVKDPKPGIVITGDPIILSAGETNTDNFAGIYTLTGEDIAVGSVKNQATVQAVDPKEQVITDKSDDNSILEDDPTILPLNACKIAVYNAVSPNGDGINDVFKIDGIKCYHDAYVEIYDRWGVLVYDAYGYDNETVVFRGVSEGRATVKQKDGLPDGTYFYVITYKTYLNEPMSLTGYLYISE